MDLKRLLHGNLPPSIKVGEYLAEFPVEWVFDRSLTIEPLELIHTSDSHFEIAGEINIAFAHYLKKHSNYVYPEWPKGDVES